MKPSQAQLLLAFGMLSFTCSILLLYYGSYTWGSITMLGGLLLAVFALRAIPQWRSYSFTLVIFLAAALAMLYPGWFQQIGAYKLSNLIVPILMVIMFGMGTSMSLSDFIGVIRMPEGVFVGIICQFSIMPFVGFGLASLSGLPAEIAAGIILVGCSPSGLASNVMTYIAKANLALSLTLTMVATLLAPLLTPLLMNALANQYIEINFLGMFWSIVKIVIIPVILGLVFNRMFQKQQVLMNRIMPRVSMAGIAIVIMIITAAGRESLLDIGLVLIGIVVAHNTIGYFLGYWAGRLSGLDEQSARTIALEVGMQNSGLASGIAVEMGKIATMGLAPAIFGPFMNITGSSLASYWGGKRIKDK